jgi:hypothetical protein
MSSIDDLLDPDYSDHDGDRFAPLDLVDLLSGPPPAEDWLIWPLIERGQLVSLYSAPKVGKSLVMLDLVTRAVTGQPLLDRVRRDPIRVLYIDAENSHKDLRKRLTDMHVDPSTLGNLAYVSFPPLLPLDTSIGALQLQEIAKKHQPDLVIIDTVSRFINGDENDSSTWLDMYRLALAPLKGQGTAVLRLDHSGKDEDRGSRGSSAKDGDVDSVWKLTYDEAKKTRTLKRDRTRTGAGPEHVVLDVKTQPLRHERTSILDYAADPVSHLVRKLDEHGVPAEWGKDRAGQVLKDKGQGYRTANLVEAQKVRRERPQTVPDPLDQTPPGNGFGNVPDAGNGSERERVKPQVNHRSHTSERSGTASTVPATPHPRGGGTERSVKIDDDQTHSNPVCAGCGHELDAGLAADGYRFHPLCEPAEEVAP